MKALSIIGIIISTMVIFLSFVAIVAASSNSDVVDLALFSLLVSFYLLAFSIVAVAKTSKAKRTETNASR